MTTAALQRRTLWLAGFVALCWLVLGVDAIAPGSFAELGVRPRQLEGLRGVLFAPFLHGNAAHLASNSVPLLALGALVLIADAKRFVAVTACVVVSSGLAAWLLGPSQSVHIGASGVVFGYLGFLLFHGWFTRRVGMMLLSIVVAAVWGGLVFGVLPGTPGISWQSHAGGFAGGVAAARLFAARRAKRGATRVSGRSTARVR